MMKTTMIGLALLSASVLTCAPVMCFSQESAVARTDPEHQTIPRILLEPSVDDTLVQVELS
jgi:hypothetical protein